MTVKEFIGSAEYDPSGQQIFGNKNGGLQIIAEVRGWGAIQHLFKTQVEAEKFQDELGQFIANAINEKINNNP